MRRNAALRRAATWAVTGGLVAGAVVAGAALLGLTDTAAVVPVMVVVAAVFAAVKFAKDGLRATIVASQRTSERSLEQRLRRLDAHVARLERRFPQAAAAAAVLAVESPYPMPLGGSFGLAWDVAGLLAREVALARPTTVVELGSGASSLVIGQQLRRIGAGHLLTLDHESIYAEATRRQVEIFGLEDWVTVLDAPLLEQEVRGSRYRWYDLPAQVRALAQVDILVVDGPPQTVDREGSPRYPALPVFDAQLGATALVFCDDAARAGEKAMLQRWLAEDPDWTLEIADTSKGTGLLRRKLPAT